MRAMDVMTTNVITITPDTSVQNLAHFCATTASAGSRSWMRPVL
jgi:hypothetical protein